MKQAQPKLYQAELPDIAKLDENYWVRAGHYRPPKKGEAYLSGAIPTVYYAPNDLRSPYIIMRPATDEEIYCPCCGQTRRVER